MRLRRVQSHAELRGVSLELRFPDAAPHELLEELVRCGSGSRRRGLFVEVIRGSIRRGFARERFGPFGVQREAVESDRERARVRELGQRALQPCAQRVDLRFRTLLDVLHLLDEVGGDAVGGDFRGEILGCGGGGGIRRGSRAHRARLRGVAPLAHVRAPREGCREVLLGGVDALNQGLTVRVGFVGVGGEFRLCGGDLGPVRLSLILGLDERGV